MKPKTEDLGRVRYLALLLVLVLLTNLLLATTVFAGSNSYTIQWLTIDGGGGTSANGNFALHGTIGQPDAGLMTNGVYTLFGGFLAKPPGEVNLTIFLPFVAR